MLRVFSALVLVVAVGSCGPRPPPENLLEEPGQSDVELRVVSHNSRDVVIYFYAGNRSFDQSEHGGNPLSSSSDPNGDRFATLTATTKTSTNLAGRQRLGLAGGNSITEFKIPWQRVSGSSRVHLLAERVGDASEIWSDPLQLTQGSVVVWTLELQLEHSSVAVY
jgi:hypothetical protein